MERRRGESWKWDFSNVVCVSAETERFLDGEGRKEGRKTR